MQRFLRIYFIILLFSILSIFSISVQGSCREKCVFPTILTCQDYQITSDFIMLKLINGGGKDITINEMSISGKTIKGECANKTSITLQSGEDKTISLPCKIAYTLTRSKYEIKINYTSKGTESSHIITGELFAKEEYLPGFVSEENYFIWEKIEKILLVLKDALWIIIPYIFLIFYTWFLFKNKHIRSGIIKSIIVVIMGVIFIIAGVILMIFTDMFWMWFFAFLEYLLLIAHFAYIFINQHKKDMLAPVITLICLYLFYLFMIFGLILNFNSECYFFNLA